MLSVGIACTLSLSFRNPLFLTYYKSLTKLDIKHIFSDYSPASPASPACLALSFNAFALRSTQPTIFQNPCSLGYYSYLLVRDSSLDLFRRT
jgi:hypothetical protein